MLKGTRDRLEAARRELLELSTRSRLLDTPRHRARSRSLEIVDEKAEEMYRLLVRERKSLVFQAASDPGETPEPPPPAAPPPEGAGPVEIGLAARHVDTRLRTSLPREALHRRLLQLHYDARTFEEEQGVNILFLALGFLRWMETGGDRERHAPLLLVPVRLERQSAAARFRLLWSEEEIGTNLSLQAKLKLDFGLDLPDLPEPDDLSPAAYFGKVAEAVAARPGWSVLPDDAVLSFFSFSKFLMYRDLDPANWPEERALDVHPLLSALLSEDGFRPEPPLWPEDRKLDPHLHPRDLVHVVDADSSQTAAIEEVKRGRNLVVQGPPGTGKSQTIINLIAAAVKGGRKVLFVAEKLAALEVVKRRLENIGLGDLCLELHSHKARKRFVLDDLGRTLALAPPKTEEVERRAGELLAARDRLNRHAEFMHRPLPRSGVSPFEAIGRLVHLQAGGVPAADFALPGAEDWTPEQLEEKSGILADIVPRLEALGRPSDHPWRGAGLESVLPTDVQRIRDRLPGLLARVEALRAAAGSLAEKLGTPAPGTIAGALLAARLGRAVAEAPRMDRRAIADPSWAGRRNEIAELVRNGSDLARVRAKLQGVVSDAGWSAELGGARRDLAAHGRSWLRWLSGPYRRAKAALRGILAGEPPRPLAARLEILDDLMLGQKAAQALGQGGDLGRAAFGSLWAGEKSDWTALAAIDEWERRSLAAGVPEDLRRAASSVADVEEVRRASETLERDGTRTAADLGELFGELRLDLGEAFAAADPKTIPVSDLAARLRAWSDDTEALASWIAYRLGRDRLRAADLGPLAERAQDGRLRPGEILDRFRIAFFEAVLRRIGRENPEFAGFDGRSHERLVEAFRGLDRERIRLARAEVARAHYEGIPRGTAEVGQLGLVRREIQKKRRHLPLRQLLRQAGKAVQAIKPVFMMSPLSVAQFLAPGAAEFDLLLVDEASQVRPEDAFGAVARARQMVVVGDDKQLPPTRFFHRLLGEEEAGGEEDEIRAADMESILDLCIAQNAPQRMLRWHYRSRHPSLIAVSNREFYGNGLIVVPSPLGRESGLGLRLHRAAGTVFDRGGTATNRGEAGLVARAVMEHARARPDVSLGVGAFSVAQRDAILDELERLRREAKDMEPFFSTDRPEPFFVKNLETIQGDERDVVFISVGYGRDAGGALTMNFGPLSALGGERRLNVLITRARLRCEVFSSIGAEDIDPARATGRGAHVLRTFLAFAETGRLEAAATGAALTGSPFEETVARAIAARGFRVEPRVGLAGLFVDLAVADPGEPGRFLLGVECDGAAYEGARTARDRDRLRAEVLEDNGWAIHRVWSGDWLRRPQDELGRAVRAIEAARARREATTVRRRGTEAPREEVRREEAAGPGPVAAPLPYREASFPVDAGRALQELSVPEMTQIVARIVEIEGPVHREEVARRAAALAGLARTGSRVAEAVETALDRAAALGLLERRGEFLCRKGQMGFPVRDRGGVRSATLRDAEMLPPEEIRTALLQVVAAQVGVPRGEAVVEASRLFGYKAAGAPLRERFDREAEELVRSGALRERDGHLEC